MPPRPHPRAEPRKPDHADAAAETGAEAPIEPTDDIVEAWHRWVEVGQGRSERAAAFLRSSDVAEARTDGEPRGHDRFPGRRYERIGSTAPVLSRR